MIKITIITPCLNRKSFVAQAIDSVVTQGIDGVEHIVVDGGSTDGTLDVLANYPELTIFCEPDLGVYDAMNKGLARAQGEIIGFLNTDDKYLPGALKCVLETFDAHPDIDSVCGAVEIRSLEDGTVLEIGSEAMKKLRAGDLISAQTLTNARFFRKRVFKEIGQFDITYPRCADRLFLAKCLLRDMRTQPINQTIYQYGAHAGSLTFNIHGDNLDIFEEMLTIAATNLSAAQSAPARRFFRRWYGWVSGYLAIKYASKGSLPKAWKKILDASRFDPFWLVYFVKHSAWHIMTRHEWRPTRHS